MKGGPPFETIDPGYPIRRAPYGAAMWAAGHRVVEGKRTYLGPCARHRASWNPGPVRALRVASWKQAVMWEMRALQLECLVNARPTDALVEWANGGVR